MPSVALEYLEICCVQATARRPTGPLQHTGANAGLLLAPQQLSGKRREGLQLPEGLATPELIKADVTEASPRRVME